MVITILLIIGLLTGASTVISTFDIYKDKKFTKAGVALIIVNAVIIGLLALQYFVNENQQERKDHELKTQYEKSLATVKSSFDTSTVKIITTVSNVLGKYGFKLDSTNNKLVKLIRDSSNNKTIIEEGIPVLVFCIQKQIFKKDGKFHFSIESRDAGSTGFDFRFFVVLSDSLNVLSYWGSLPSQFENSEKLPKDVCLSIGFGLQVNNAKTLYVLMRGSYKSLSGKSFYVNDMAYYKIDKDESGLLDYATRQEVIDFVNERIKK